MPGLDHATIVDMVREDPRALFALLRAVGLQVRGRPELLSKPEDITEITPVEYRADAVLVLGRPKRGGRRSRSGRDDSERTSARGKYLEAFVIEIQLGRDVKKRWSWPQYVAGLRAQLRCPATLVVLTITPGMARW